MKHKIIIERADPNLNETIEEDSEYKAWITYYHYKDKIGYGKEWNKVIINVKIE